MIALIVSLVSVGYFADNDAYAARAGAEFSNPTQTNAYASYNTVTNQVQVSWDFDTLPADTTCLLKGDFVWYEDLNDKHTSGVSGVDYDKVTGFIPIYYSVVSSSPTVVDTLSEEVPCENGSIRIDIDTIMSHSENINNYNDLEIFLSFYVANADGSLNLADASRIDEVFVLYTPNNIWDNAAQEYGCGGQIGSTLYIDQSAERIHGNNGDNCDGAEFEYVALNSNQWVDIGMDDSPGLALGVELKGDHTPSSYSLLVAVSSPSIATAVAGSGSGNESKTRPTFGLDHNTGISLVEYGLKINGVPFNIDDNWWTEIPMQNMTVGDMQKFTATTYAPYKVMVMEFLFGVPGVGFWQDAEAAIALIMDYDGTIIDWEVKNPENIIDTRFMMITSSDTLCFPDDDKEQCQQFTAEFSFNSAPISKVLALQAIDFRHRSQITYFNDGIDLKGPSLLPPVQKAIISEIKHKGMQTIERIDRVNDIWMTLDENEPVKLYKRNSFDSFIPIELNEVKKTQTELRDILKRNDSYFSDFKLLEEKHAELIFDSSKIQAVLGPAFGYEFPLSPLRMDSHTETLKSEETRGGDVYAQMYPNTQR